MISIIRKIMSHPSLIEQPPVLIDIGASGALPAQWQLIAPYSICVAFDADTRDFQVGESEDKGWRKLYSLNRLVSAQATGEIDFYLTQSPHCSSSLQPDNKALEPWAFSPLFEVEGVVKLPVVDLQGALARLGIDYIDWYKTDTQGTDLRIFDSLAENIKNKIVAAEFEPGIIDAYVGEDKLHQLMAYMDTRPFWVSQMEIKGSQRIDKAGLASLNFMQKRSMGSFLKIAPGWCEISYINSLQSSELTGREYLLAWIFSTIKGEHGFALHVAKLGADKFQVPLFNELHAFSLKSFPSSRKSFPSEYLKLAEKAARKAVRLISGRR